LEVVGSSVLLVDAEIKPRDGVPLAEVVEPFTDEFKYNC